jgi:hypothetical protein
MSADPGSLLMLAWQDFTFDVNDPPLPSQDDATDGLQVRAPTLTDQEGDDWFVAVATLYNDLGIINNATYLSLRGEVNSTGEAGSNQLFDALIQGIVNLTETPVVADALVLEFNTQALAQIPTSISTLETDRDAQSDPDLTVAYNEAIASLRAREEELNTLLGN